MKCIFAVAAVLLMAQADAHSQTANRASSIRLAEIAGTCSGPGEQRFVYGTKKCFPGGTYYQICTSGRRVGPVEDYIREMPGPLIWWSSDVPLPRATI